MWDIQLFKLNYDGREAQAAAEVIRGGWLTMGERVLEFEARFGELLSVGAPSKVHCLAVSNGTAALHMAVLALGLGAGDEVIIPALTFVADANVVKLVGAEPILADVIGEGDLNTSARSIEQNITPRTRAVIIVHYGGYACNMDAIVDVCRRRKLALIEDAAHAPGATFKGRALGTFGDVGCFSFFSNKNLSIGEGGLFCTLNAELAQRSAYLRSHGMTSLTLDRHKGRAHTYDVVQPGMNCRMDEVHAAIGCVQLDKLENGNQLRLDLTRRYRDQLRDSAITVPFGQGDRDEVGISKPACHILPVVLPPGCDRRKVMDRMKADRIQTSIHYPPFWSFQAYRHYDPASTPVTASFIDRVLTLPLFPTMTTREVDTVVASLLSACNT